MNERVKCILRNINSYQIGRPFAIIPRCPKSIEHKLHIEYKSVGIYISRLIYYVYAILKYNLIYSIFLNFQLYVQMNLFYHNSFSKLIYFDHIYTCFLVSLSCFGTTIIKQNSLPCNDNYSQDNDDLLHFRVFLIFIQRVYISKSLYKQRDYISINTLPTLCQQILDETYLKIMFGYIYK